MSINPSLTKPFANYPHIRKAGSFYFLAGQGCRDPQTNRYTGFTDNNTDGPYDIAKQAEGCFLNITRALESCNLKVSDLVDVTVFLKDKNDFEKFNFVWNHFFSDQPSPSRTTVFISDLPGHNYVELKATAYREEYNDRKQG